MTVYFIQSGREGPVKIGSSDDPYKRLLALQTGNPNTLTLIGVYPGGEDEEQRLHRRFNKYRMRGEWFFADKAITSYIEEKCGGYAGPTTAPGVVNAEIAYVESESKLLNVVRKEIIRRREAGSSWAEIAAEVGCPVHRIRTFVLTTIRYPRVHDVEHAYRVLTGRELDLK